MSETQGSAATRPRLSPIRLLIAGVLLVSITGTVVFLFFVITAYTNSPIQISSDFGTVLTPPDAPDNFTLTDTSGSEFQLSDLEGNYTVMSFGYTHCPDVCPVTLTAYKRVKQELADAADNVNFVFVSVDGERDTPELLNRYIQRFDPAFIALTTDNDEVMQAVADDFNVFYEKRELQGTQAGYLVDHTASLFLLNPQGEVIVLYPFGTPPVDIATDILGLLS